MTKSFLTDLNSELKELRNTGLYKSERVITSKQAGTVALDSGWEVINLCANNYLGLSDNAELIEAGREAPLCAIEAKISKILPRETACAGRRST